MAGAPTTARDVTPTRVATDPGPPPDGLCLMCENERSPTAVRHEDPFCGRPCCERWYDGALPRTVRELLRAHGLAE